MRIDIHTDRHKKTDGQRQRDITKLIVAFRNLRMRLTTDDTITLPELSYNKQFLKQLSFYSIQICNAFPNKLLHNITTTIFPLYFGTQFQIFVTA